VVSTGRSVRARCLRTRTHYPHLRRCVSIIRSADLWRVGRYPKIALIPHRGGKFGRPGMTMFPDLVVSPEGHEEWLKMPSHGQIGALPLSEC
jgi:hypothetical protein